MALLIDKVDPDRWGIRHRTTGEEVFDRSLLTAARNVFEVTNVRDLVERMKVYTPDSKWTAPELDLAKFPNVGPPFDNYWMEWHPDPFLRDDFAIERVGAEIINVAPSDHEHWRLYICLFVQTPHREPIAIGNSTIMVERLTGDVLSVPPISLVDPADPDLYGYLGSYGRRKGRREEIEREQSTDEWLADLTDRSLDDLRTDIEEYERVLAAAQERQAERRRDINELYANVIYAKTFPVILMTHSLLGCKNVERDQHARPDKLIRARRKRGGNPATRFETLRIRPTGGGGGGAHDGHKVGDGQTAMHLVRGHFKRFTEAAPLLGKHVGTYWWSPAVRGNAEQGAVVKDYRVEV